MTISEIAKWLIGEQDYAEGVRLYIALGQNSFLKSVFARHETAYNKQRLLQELTGIMNKQPGVMQEPDSEGTQPSGKTLKIQSEELNLMPEDVRGIHQRAMDLFKINARRHADAMGLIREARKIYGRKEYAKINAWLLEQGSGELVNTILDTRDEIQELLYKVDYYKVNKKFPEAETKEKTEVANGALLKQQLSNVRSKISKAKKKRDEKALGMLTAERAELERRLDELV